MALASLILLELRVLLEPLSCLRNHTDTPLMSVSMAKSKKLKQSHTDNVKHGMGDYMGVGSRNPVGKGRSSLSILNPVSKKGLKTPPKKLA